MKYNSGLIFISVIKIIKMKIIKWDILNLIDLHFSASCETINCYFAQGVQDKLEYDLGNVNGGRTLHNNRVYW